MHFFARFANYARGAWVKSARLLNILTRTWAGARLLMDVRTRLIIYNYTFLHGCTNVIDEILISLGIWHLIYWPLSQKLQRIRKVMSCLRIDPNRKSKSSVLGNNALEYNRQRTFTINQENHVMSIKHSKKKKHCHDGNLKNVEDITFGTVYLRLTGLRCFARRESISHSTKDYVARLRVR